MSFTELQEASAELSTRDKAAFASWLLDDLLKHDEPLAFEQSLRVAEERRKEIFSNTVKPISGEKFWGNITDERKKWR